MSSDDPHPPQRNLVSPPSDRMQRRRAVAQAGHEGDEDVARSGLTDPDPGVRGTAIGALTRLHRITEDDLRKAVTDLDPGVRRRVAGAIASEATDPTSAAVTAFPTACATILQTLLGDEANTVIEVTAWATGEWIGAAREHGRAIAELDLVARLEALAVEHDDALCREAAVAALGAIGDDGSLGAILRATTDKATVRRRAIIALAPYDGPEVEAALARAREDRDWQVRQAAEDLLAITDDDEPGAPCGPDAADAADGPGAEADR